MALLGALPTSEQDSHTFATATHSPQPAEKTPQNLFAIIPDPKASKISISAPEHSSQNIVSKPPRGAQNLSCCPRKHPPKPSHLPCPFYRVMNRMAAAERDFRKRPDLITKTLRHQDGNGHELHRPHHGAWSWLAHP